MAINYTWNCKTVDVKTIDGNQDTVFVPVLIKAIQEQQNIIEDLKLRIETLEG